MSTTKTENFVWQRSLPFWGFILLSVLISIVLFSESLSYLIATWESREEYSYGYIVPFISVFFVWQKKDILLKTTFTGSWSGLFLAIAGILLFVIGELSTLYIITQYAFVVVLFGLVLALSGWRAMRILWVPVFFLVFMIPLPNFLLQAISAELQLISSKLGVWVIALFGISVNLEGNVIDLGNYQLQVVEACSGLRYLFPLMTFGFIAAYFFNASIWQRVVLFLSTIPITVLMNSFRIGVIGVMVDYWGSSMAEGFLHDFEGWVVFMACVGVLVLEMWILSKISKDRRPLRDIFVIELPARLAEDIDSKIHPLPKPLVATGVFLLIAGVTVQFMPNVNEIHPDRKQFSEFPLAFGNWQGSNKPLEKIYVDALKFEDYLMTDYKNLQGEYVNFYIAYYASQRKGESAHSPRTCIPGGGWKIESISQLSIDGVDKNRDIQVKVNRTLVSFGEQKQLVYYWFQQRGRNITNEYLVKWYLLWDALTKQRTDGALVRLTTLVDKRQGVDKADKLLRSFIAEVNGVIFEYVPD